MNEAWVLNQLREWEQLVWEHHREDFIKRFCGENKILDLMNTHWNSETMYVHYVLDNGQHMGDTFSISEWEDFLKEYSD